VLQPNQRDRGHASLHGRHAGGATEPAQPSWPRATATAPGRTPSGSRPPSSVRFG
jgi:hypothetical protein